MVDDQTQHGDFVGEAGLGEVSEVFEFGVSEARGVEAVLEGVGVALGGAGSVLLSITMTQFYPM